VRTILVAFSLMVILSAAACGQASSPVERQEKQGGVEQTERQDTLTEKELSRMSYERVLALLDCQLEKIAADKGEKAAEDYVVEKINERAEEGTDATPVQIELWREGYTCTPKEVDRLL
jgi:hypothetical protein